jgi:galactose-1-phosphate uridylyltransferase
MLSFDKTDIFAKFIAPSGEPAKRRIEVRTNPVTGRTCRIALSRISETEKGTDSLPPPPPEAQDTSTCPFCRPQVEAKTPRCVSEIAPSGCLIQGESRLFPNLFPYGSYSAVSLFDNRHFVEIGMASVSSYSDCFINCRNYLRQVFAYDSQAVYMAITQNHLPSAGGSLVHPHLQINADAVAGNHHRFLKQRAERYFQETGQYLFSDYLRREKEDGARCIGKTGDWEWIAAFAPEGFFEIWGILPKAMSLRAIESKEWEDLAQGVINAQKFYRSLCRNGYNLGILSVEEPSSRLELRCVLIVRSNYAPWVRNDHTGFELMLGDMATFTLPEKTAETARPFWKRLEQQGGPG